MGDSGFPQQWIEGHNGRSSLKIFSIKCDELTIPKRILVTTIHHFCTVKALIPDKRVSPGPVGSFET